MGPTHEIFPFDEDKRIAAALGTLLVQRDSQDPHSLTEVANQLGVDPERLGAAALRLGIEGEIEDFPEVADRNAKTDRGTPDFLKGKEPIRREYSSHRSLESNEVSNRTNNMPFQSWLLVEATKSARETVNRILQKHFGEEADTLRVATRAAVGTADFPERILWVGVSYPVDAGESGSVPAVPNSPSFSFDQLTKILPLTLDILIEHEGENFYVRNIPIISFREPYSH